MNQSYDVEVICNMDGSQFTLSLRLVVISEHQELFAMDVRGGRVSYIQPSSGETVPQKIAGSFSIANAGLSMSELSLALCILHRVEASKQDAAFEKFRAACASKRILICTLPGQSNRVLFYEKAGMLFAAWLRNQQSQNLESSTRTEFTPTRRAHEPMKEYAAVQRCEVCEIFVQGSLRRRCALLTRDFHRSGYAEARSQSCEGAEGQHRQTQRANEQVSWKLAWFSLLSVAGFDQK